MAGLPTSRRKRLALANQPCKCIRHHLFTSKVENYVRHFCEICDQAWQTSGIYRFPDLGWEICRAEEPGTLRFEFYPDPDDENGIFLYEAYVDEAAFQTHMKNNAAFIKNQLLEAKGESLATMDYGLFLGDAIWPPKD